VGEDGYQGKHEGCRHAVPTGTYHADNGPRDNVVDEGGVKGLSLEVLVVLLSDLTGGLVQLQGLELEALLLKAADDVT
jgi:hypothetical protein